MDDDDLDLFEIAEDAEKVRGQHFTAWWGEVERLGQAQQWGEYEALLGEMRDAAERGAQIVGYTVAPGPSMALARRYEEQGDTEGAIAELERFVAAINRFRNEEPEGGDTGHRRALETLQQWKTQNPGQSRPASPTAPVTRSRPGGQRPRRLFRRGWRR